MSDLDSELRRLATAMVKEAPDAPSFGVATTAPSRSAQHARVPRRSAALIAGALLLVLVAVVIAVLASPDGSQQQAAAPAGFQPCTQEDPGPFVGPDGKRFGPVPNAHPEGGTVTAADIAAVPDYIPVTCQSSETIGGWVKKTDMYGTGPVPILNGEVVPVYADDGTTVVGSFGGGQGFVPIDRPSSVGSQPTFEVIEPADGAATRCLRATYAGGTDETCLAAPGASMWRVNGIDYVLYSGPLNLSDGTVVPANVGPFTVVPASEVASRTQELQGCYSTELADAVAATLPRPHAAYHIGGCSPTFAFVGSYSPEPDQSPTSWFQRGPDDRWSFVATVDFSNPDRAARCSVLPDEPLAPGSTFTVRQQCQLLG
jgi:hypothetical protein